MHEIERALMPPALEGCIGGHGASRLLGSGAGAFTDDGEGVQVAGFGRLRFLDPACAALAARAGMAQALRAAWRLHGADLPSRLGGDYLVALWEPSARRGLVAVDRFGTHPLYWGTRDGRLAFATRPRQVCDLLGVSAQLDARAVHAFVYFHVIPAPLSIHRGVSRLDIGQLLWLARGGTEVRTHWRPAFEESRRFAFERERHDFIRALKAGVAECIEGVPRERLGCFLSGGTDSSTIAGLVSQAYGGPARTFSIGFDVSGYDERRYARTAALRFGTDHTEHVLSPQEAEAAIDQVTAAHEQPFGNASAVPTYVCARLARDHGITRLLGGDGGDELYGGNERYATQWLFSLYGRIPGPIRAGLLEAPLFGALRHLQGFPFGKARSYIEQARLPLPERLGARYNLLNRFGAERVFSDAVLAGSGEFDPQALEREVYARTDGCTQINRLLAFDFKFTLGDSDLPKVTRMCRAAGVEVAFPMLAHDVVDHSLRLPPGQKLRGRQLRHFFKASLRGFLPDVILDKPKHGFGMPFGDWVLGQPRMAARVSDALGSLESRGLLRTGFLNEVNDAVHSGHAGYFGTLMWVLMSLELWLRAQDTGGAGR